MLGKPPYNIEKTLNRQSRVPPAHNSPETNDYAMSPVGAALTLARGDPTATYVRETLW